MGKHKHKKRRSQEQYVNYDMMQPNPQMNMGTNGYDNSQQYPGMNNNMNNQNPQMNNMNNQNPQMNNMNNQNPQMNQWNNGMNQGYNMNSQNNGQQFMPPNPFGNLFGGGMDNGIMSLLSAFTGGGAPGGAGQGDLLSNLISAFVGGGSNTATNQSDNSTNQSNMQNGMPQGLDFNEIAKMVSGFMSGGMPFNEQEQENDTQETTNGNFNNIPREFTAIFSNMSEKDMAAFQNIVSNFFGAAKDTMGENMPNIEDLFQDIDVSEVLNNLNDKDIQDIDLDGLDVDLNNLSLSSLNENLNSNDEIIDVENVVEVDDKESRRKPHISKKFSEDELYDIIKILIQLVEPYKLELLKKFLKASKK